MICGFELVTRRIELVTRGFELVTRGFELVTRGFELATRGFEFAQLNLLLSFQLVTCSLFFHRVTGRLEKRFRHM